MRSTTHSFHRQLFTRSCWCAVALGVVLATAWTSFSGLSAQTQQLRLVSTSWPPFTNATQPRFALDLVDAALTRIGITASTTIVDPAQYTTSLLSGNFDGSGAAWKDPERERVLIFSQPYLENRLILVARRGGNVSATTMAALKGRRVAIVDGYSYGDTVDGSGPTFVRSKSDEDSLTMLLSNAVDYTLMDELVVQNIVDNYASEAREKLQFGTVPLVRRQLFLAIRRNLPDAQGIINRFNAQLRGMIADRTYHRLLHVDWITADVDGDGLAEYVAGNEKSTAQPQRSYNLFSDPTTPTRVSDSQQRYFFGGSIYNGWTAVPDMYKDPDPVRPDPNRSAVNVFRFTW